MGKSIYRCGVVINGDFSGKSVYKNDSNSYIIISNDENGKIIVNSLFPTHFSILQVISKDTVERYEEVSSSKNGADASAIAKGLFWAGLAGGLLGAASSQSASFDIAIYFKNGKKSLIRINNSSSYQDLKSILFVL